jgi:hypothetical protein
MNDMTDIFDIISEESSKAEQSKSEIPAVVKNKLDNMDLIPVAYQIFKLVNGKIENGIIVSGTKSLIDTMVCDRAKNYVPNQRAIGKADLLKKHDKGNIYFVLGIYTEISSRKEISEIIHESQVTESTGVHFTKKGRGNAYYQTR